MAGGIGRREVRMAPDYVERFAAMSMVMYDPAGVGFVVDFYKPDIRIEVDEKGRPVNVAAELVLVARMYLPPVAAKVLLKNLEASIKAYEERFGEIRLPVPPAAGEKKGEDGEGSTGISGGPGGVEQGAG